MRDERAELIQHVLDLQFGLYRSLRPAREWLEVDLTMPQLKLMFLLYSESGAPMSRLAGSLGVTLSTATGIVDRLVEHGMVQREEDPQDRRLVVCRLTPRGLETVERLHQAGRSRLACLLDDLSVGDLRTVAAGLDVLVAAARRVAAAEECLPLPSTPPHAPTNGGQGGARRAAGWAVRAATS